MCLKSNKPDADSLQYYFDIVPYAYQQTILDRLQIEREVYGSYRNLIVAATGTGKTVVAAFDFKRFYKEKPGAKVLFLAHSTLHVFAAVGDNTINSVKAFREGVRYFSGLNMDVFFVTLNKSEKHYKESTRYEDYAINQELFHWQSQSRTSDISPTGQRYITMRENESRVLLFVREERSDAYGNTEVYRLLGLVKYVSHQSSAPISITYKLDEKMPMEILNTSNQIVKIV